MGDVADVRSDVYALGAVLYFLLCGRPPFEADNAAALFFAHVHQNVIPPSQALGRQLPSDIDALAMRALEKNPAARYATAADFALALADCTLAGKWTFGHATEVARKSSHPPPSGIVQSMLPSLAAPRVPSMLDVPDPPPSSSGQGETDVAASRKANFPSASR
jgi:serine/threonine protein kinase